MSEPFDHVFAKLEGVRRTGPGKWMARCPGHDDRSPSLSLAIGQTGNLIVKCHAGCETETLLAAAGLKFADLMVKTDDGTPRARRREIAWYKYRDENGTLLYETVRYEPKDFRQRRPNPEHDPTRPRGEDNNEWIWNVDGCRKVPYKLPELRKALQERPDRIVHVLEGEKDCDVLWSLGFLATCNVGGALKWTDEHSKHLAGCRVLIVPDEDLSDPKRSELVGLAHARLVRASLAGVASSARIVRLPCPVGGKVDATRFLDDGPTGAEERAKRWREFVESRLSRSAIEEVTKRLAIDHVRKEEAMWLACQAWARFMVAASADIKREEAIDAAAALLALADLLE